MPARISYLSKEVDRLKSCMSDLIAVLAVPTIRGGGTPGEIVGTRLDVLRGILDLDFACAQKWIPDGAPPQSIWAGRSEGWPDDNHLAGLLDSCARDDFHWQAHRSKCGGEDVSIALCRLGLQPGLGVLIAGSLRVDFPAETERLVLNVAANQIAVGLQDAVREERRASEQRRVEAELERRVAERTEALSRANETLLREVALRKLAEEALRLAQSRLARAMQVAAAGELSAAIAHEINQPLASVVAGSSAGLHWLSGNPPDLGRTRSSIERVLRDGEAAGAVIQRIRSLFNGVAINRGPLDINEIVMEVAELLGGEASRKNIALRLDLAQDLPLALGDRIQLQQVLSNLMTNAIEAMDFVDVDPGHPADRRKRISVRTGLDDATAIRVEVADEGVGIKGIDRAFEPFFTTKKNGIGMGLPICRTIIQAHDGRLWAQAGDSCGTMFCFTVPYQKPPYRTMMPLRLQIIRSIRRAKKAP
jgi:signal transduction histidine kinase